jgi:hypothetical protein
LGKAGGNGEAFRIRFWRPRAIAARFLRRANFLVSDRKIALPIRVAGFGRRLVKRDSHGFRLVFQNQR